MKNVMQKCHIVSLWIFVALAISIETNAGAEALQKASNSNTDPISVSMAKIIEGKEQIESLVKHGHLQPLHNELILIDALLASTRKELDTKLVLSGGPVQGYAGNTTEIIGQLEAIRTLVRIALGFSSPFYSFPKGHVPDSVKNAIEAAHTESELLLESSKQWAKTEITGE